ncbi:MAG: ABC transporter substrate-binding protein [Oscillospiraceae bacterium]|nr:ABC transporter substrate-binding protein [Oscillospiraceae bacterium]
MKIRKILLFLLVCFLLSACGSPKSSNAVEASDTAVTFTDDLGRAVTVSNPKRVAALLGSFAEVWQLAGGQVIATADDAWDDFCLELPEDAVNLGGTKHLSLELLLSAQPDFILASTNTRQNLEFRETLEATSIPVAYFDVFNFEDYLRLLDICTDITGYKDRYEIYGTAVEKEIQSVVEQSKLRLQNQQAPRVLFLRASASAVHVKNSEGVILGDMLKNLGCINIADSDATLLENLSIERILEADPDFIFVVQQGDNAAGTREYVRQFLQEHPAWAQLTAVKQDNVHFMEKQLFGLKPNHRWGQAYSVVEEILANG